jgi:hypothetical protein
MGLLTPDMAAAPPDEPGDLFEGPLAGLLLFIGALLLSCAAAFAAGFAIIVASGPLARIEPAWMGEALEAVIVAVAWMLVGLAVAGRRAAGIAPILFLFGAAAAWMLARGIVHTASPYYGLFSFGIACVGAAIVWAVHRRRERARSTRAIVVFLPLMVVAAVFLNTLLRAPIGIRRVVGDVSGRAMQVAPTERGVYIWSKSNMVLPFRPDGIVLIELDPGSGPSTYRATEIVDAQQVHSACAALRAAPDRLIGYEVDAGHTPGFMRLLPIRYRSCETGRIWLAEPSES